MQNFKKAILYITGPGVIIFEAVVLFIHLFTPINTKSYIVGGLIVFFAVFIPVYFVEYFKQNIMERNNKRNLQFKNHSTRTEWGGGNIHGRTPSKVKRPGKLFNKKTR